CSDHDHRRAKLDALIQVDDMLVDHAEAAIRSGAADGPWLVGAVNADIGVDIALVEIEGAGAERILRAAVHAVLVAGIFLRLALDHALGRDPARPFLLVADHRSALELESLLTDGDAVAARLAPALDQVEILVGGVDDDGAGRIARERHDLRLEAFLDLE